jgi:excisionase family DNA binding protein
MSDDQELLNIREAAQTLGVHENTVRNWVDSGQLAAVRLPNSGFRRVIAAEVTALAQARALEVSRSMEDDVISDEPEFAAAVRDAINALIRRRRALFLKQEDMATMLGLLQQDVSRFERNMSTGHRLKLIFRYARAVGAQVRINISVSDDIADADVAAQIRHLEGVVADCATTKANLRADYGDILRKIAFCTARIEELKAKSTVEE